MQTKKPFKGRVYHEPDGTYLSVTSIIHPDGIDFPSKLLEQYALRGSIIHSQVEHYLKYYQWLSKEQIASPQDLLTVEQGSLKLSFDSIDPRGFFQEHGHKFEIMHLEQKLKNKTYKYAGRADVIGKYENKLCIADFKTTTNYTKSKINDYFMQLSAYANCVTPVPKALVIIPFNPKSEKGYDDPMVETDVQHYFSKFLTQLEHVKENYLIS